MHKIILAMLIPGLFIMMLMAGCGTAKQSTPAPDRIPQKSGIKTEETAIPLTSEMREVEDGFFAVRFEGDDGFDAFLDAGGASSDSGVAEFLSFHLMTDFNFSASRFGCSTIAVESPEGDRLFGRNFDWQACDALVVSSRPDKGYASISTVNMDFVSESGGTIGNALQLNDVLTLAALYAPLDGMNEAGLAVSVNMIQDTATIDQNTDKPDITTTTAIRLLLNQAANVEEALELLGQYDMHASMDMTVHFALADGHGRSAAVEYVDNEMVVTETPVVTNFYFADGEKKGIGTVQSHERYELLNQRLSERQTMDMQEVRDALDSVSKDNFGEFESTEWSIVFNLNSGMIHYYHRENYENRYTFQIQ
ncbi:linear amide C-N hydrolase [Lacrimispora sp. NSJ-141]|uniref:Linear amide C-N hydrolase n=1 Tax=Lientehia hominis TaxID=2897778 RepID=A0AAP2RI78_9FIRM|nr:C45 family peptidase [Lientehia hominis]MCD2492346.1 linear amide C-N hydrolase [Lientehia hominis]